MFKGIEYVANPSRHGIAFPEDIDLPDNWFEVERDFVAGCVTVANKTYIKIEGIAIMKEVTFESDMTVSIKVGSVSVPMNDVGLPNNLRESNLSVQGFLQLVREGEVCIG